MFILLPVPKGCFLVWEQPMRLRIFAIWYALLPCVMCSRSQSSARSPKGSCDTTLCVHRNTHLRFPVGSYRIDLLPGSITSPFSLPRVAAGICVLEVRAVMNFLGEEPVLPVCEMQRCAGNGREDQAPDELRSGNYGKGDLLGYKFLISFQKQNAIIVSVGKTVSVKKAYANLNFILCPILANTVN